MAATLFLAAAGWLLVAVHPYGAIPAFVALVVAAVLEQRALRRRGRGIRRHHGRLHRRVAAAHHLGGERRGRRGRGVEGRVLLRVGFAGARADHGKADRGCANQGETGHTSSSTIGMRSRAPQDTPHRLALATLPVYAEK